MLRDPVNQLAAAAADDDAPLRHRVKGRQSLPQFGIARIGVLRRMRGLQGRHRRRARSESVAVGGKIVRGHTQRVGAAMDAFKHGESPSTTLLKK